MKTITWINASAVLAAAAIALGLAGWDMGGRSAVMAPAATLPASNATFVAAVETGWLPASSARSEIEQRSALIVRFAEENGIAVRVLHAAAQARTRAADGGRLEAPLFHLARSFEFRPQDAQDVDLLRGALASWSVELRRVDPTLAGETPCGRTGREGVIGRVGPTFGVGRGGVEERCL